MMNPTIYLDTSIICYLTDPPSANSITRACQQLTRMWWDKRRVPELTFTSQRAKVDIANGDPLRAAVRLRSADSLILFDNVARVNEIAELLVLAGGLRRYMDARHVAQAAYRGIDVFATWNCADIANAARIPVVRLILHDQQLAVPEIVTLFELMENSHDQAGDSRGLGNS